MRKHILSFLMATVFVLGLAFSVTAEAPAYENDFSSGSIKVTEWKTLNLDPESNGAWDIADVNGNKQLRGQIAKFNDTILYYKAKKFKDVTVEADVILERGNAFGIIGRMDAEAKGYQIIFDQFDGIKLCKRPYYMFKSGGMIDTGSQYHVVMSIIGNKIKAQITSKSTGESLSLEVQDDTYTAAGYIGFSVFGFDTDGRSNAVGLVDNVKIYEGEAASTPSTTAPSSQGGDNSTTSHQNDSTTAPTQSGGGTQNTENSTSESVSTAPAFQLSSKYTDATVDNAAKTITLSRQLNIAEIKDTFTIPDGYSMKILDKEGKEVTDSQAMVTADMKISFTKDGGFEQLYTVKTVSDKPSDGDNQTDNRVGLIVAIVAGVLVLAGAGVGVFFFLRHKKAEAK